MSPRFFVKPISGILSGPKIAILAHLEALNFDFHELLHYLKGEIDQVNKNQKPKYDKKGSFFASRILKIDFT